MTIPTTPVQVLLPRSLVESFVRSSVDAGTVDTVMHAIDTSAHVRWTPAAGLPATAGVAELRSAVSSIQGLDGVRRARIDALLALTTSDELHTPGQAARSIGLESRDGAGLRAALQRHELDVIVRTGPGMRPVQRVPGSFLHAESAAQLLGTIGGAATAGTLTERVVNAGSRLRASAPRIGVIGTAAAGVIALSAVAGRHDGPGTKSDRVGSTGSDASADASSGDVRKEAAETAQVETDLSPKQATRAAIVQAAIDLVGTSDVHADGTLDGSVSAWKSATRGGNPTDPNTAWEIAFAAHVAREAGAPLGAGGKGARTATDLRVWAEETGRFRSPSASNAKAGNFVLLERTGSHGMTWHEVGVVAGPFRGGTGIVMIAGSRLTGATATIDGEQLYVGSVGYETVELDSTLAKDGVRIEGYIDTVSKPKAVKPAKPDRSPAAERRARAEIVARAKSQIGKKEVDGPNNGPDVDKYWRDAGGPKFSDSQMASYGLWCAAFTSWLYNEQRMPYVDRDGSLSTGEIRRWAIQNDAWHDNTTKSGRKYEPQPGDLVLFQGTNATTPVTHIGIVATYDRKTRTVNTIEGNAGRGKFTSNGDGVWAKSYDRDEKNGNGRVRIRGFVDVFDYYDRHPKGPKK